VFLTFLYSTGGPWWGQPKHRMAWGNLLPIPVIFNRGSAEPQGSASICQGFRGLSVKKNKNNLACKITSDQEIYWSNTDRICSVPN